MRYFFSTLFGLMVAFTSLLVFVFLSTFIFDLPDGIDILNIESIRENIDQLPEVNLAMIIASYGLASFMAGFSSVKIETTIPLIPLNIIGIILTILGFVIFIIIPYPLWVLVVGSFTFLPLTRLGGSLGMDKPI